MDYEIVGKGKLDYPYGWLKTDYRISGDSVVLDGVKYHIHPSDRAGLIPGRAEALGVDPNDYVAGIRWTERV